MYYFDLAEERKKERDIICLCIDFLTDPADTACPDSDGFSISITIQIGTEPEFVSIFYNVLFFTPARYWQHHDRRAGQR